MKASALPPEPSPGANTEQRFTPPVPSARLGKEKRVRRIFFVITLIPILLLTGITAILAVRFWPILSQYSLGELLTGTVWKPQNGQFGFLPFIAGTFWVTLLSVLLAVIPCLLSAIYLAEYAHQATRAIAKPVLDLLAAIPSVIYGVWGLLVIVPFIQNQVAPFFNRHFSGIPFFNSSNPTGYSVLAGGIVLAVMITPFIISITYEVLSIVPKGAREASLALGATRWHTVWHVVLPQVVPGIVAGIVLGASRALGETMAVLMVVGNVAKVPTSLFDAAYPLPALIANNYGEMMSVPLYDAALMGASLLLLLIVLLFNLLSTLVLNRFLKRPIQS
jgi:phosphate transport system permease protein